MGTVPLRRRWLGVPAAAALVLLTTASVAHGGDGATCRVVNLEQGTNGRSLVRMVERARDGDRLHVRGTCRGHVVVDVDVLIRGKGETPTLEGPGRWRTAVRVTRGASVTIRDLTVQHGRGVRNEGRLTIRHSIVRRSTTSGLENYPRSRLTLVDSVVRNNAGGGIFNIGTLHITASRIVRNSTPYFGGGIYNSYGSQVTLTDSTISGNHARRRGGGVYSGDPASGTGGEQVTLINTTVTGNFAGDGGGGVAANEPWGLTMDASSSVSGNSPDDCSPPGLC